MVCINLTNVCPRALVGSKHSKILVLDVPDGLVPIAAKWTRIGSFLEFQIAPMVLSCPQSRQPTHVQAEMLLDEQLTLCMVRSPWVNIVIPASFEEACAQFHTVVEATLGEGIQHHMRQRMLALRLFLRDHGIKRWNDRDFFLSQHGLSCSSDPFLEKILVDLGSAHQILGSVNVLDATSSSDPDDGEDIPNYSYRFAHWTLARSKLPQFSVNSAHGMLAELGSVGAYYLKELHTHATLYAHNDRGW